MENKKDKFWDRVKECKRIAKKWPKWKRDIKINSETISSGQFKKE